MVESFYTPYGSIIKEVKSNSNYFLSADCDFCIFGKDCCADGCDIHQDTANKIASSPVWEKVHKKTTGCLAQ